MPLLFNFSNCSKSRPGPKDSEILQLVLSENERKSPKIISVKSVNLDEDKELEIISLIRNGTEEILCIFKNEDKKWKLNYKKNFSLLNAGPFEYEKEKKTWVPSKNDKEGEGYIVKKILIEELPGDSFNSIFLEILSEEPPLGLFSFPYIIRKNLKIFDGLSSLKEHENLRKTRRADFTYNPSEKSISVFPSDPSYSQEFVFNGWEIVPVISGLPVASILNAEFSNFEKGKETEIKLLLKNRGQTAYVTYLSVSFPEGGVIRVDPKMTGAKIYNSGKTIYSMKEKKFIPSKYPLLEITKESWGRNYKYDLSFKFTPTVSGKQNILFRSSVKYSGNIIYLPNEYSVFPFQIDQQGFPSYPIEVGK
ncbi:MAG: hypothetical protein HS129_10405 [Leptospiraceae bacterium]|nr:hypothetical protein [Leptospiraceae bacterium]NUM41990.1 hypothetical protein [Leptospiraceae bacterium]